MYQEENEHVRNFNKNKPIPNDNGNEIKTILILDHRNVSVKELVNDIESCENKNHIYDSLKDIINYNSVGNNNNNKKFRPTKSRVNSSKNQLRVFIYCPFLEISTLEKNDETPPTDGIDNQQNNSNTSNEQEGKEVTKEEEEEEENKRYHYLYNVFVNLSHSNVKNTNLTSSLRIQGTDIPKNLVDNAHQRNTKNEQFNKSNNKFKISIIPLKYDLDILINCSYSHMCVIPLNITSSAKSIDIGFKCTYNKSNIGVLEPRLVYSEKYCNNDGSLLNINFIDKMYFMNTMRYGSAINYNTKGSKGMCILFFKNVNIDSVSILDNYLFKIRSNDNSNNYNTFFSINHYLEHDQQLVPNYFIKEKFFNSLYWDGIYNNYNINISRLSIKIILFTILKIIFFISMVKNISNLQFVYIYLLYIIVACLPQIIKYNIFNRNSIKISDSYLRPISTTKDKILINHDWMFLIIYYLYPINWAFIIIIYSLTLFMRLFK